MHFPDSIARRRQTAKQRDFLIHFTILGNVRDSAKLAGVSRAIVYYWRENSPAFADRFSAAADNAFRITLPDSPQDGKATGIRGNKGGL